MGLRLIDTVYASDLPARLRPVAAVYAFKADDDGSNCFPGAQDVADALGVKVGIVRRHRRELIAMGVLEAEIVYRDKRRLVQVRRFNAARLPQRHSSAAERHYSAGVGRSSGTTVSPTAAFSGTTVPYTTNKTDAIRRAQIAFMLEAVTRATHACDRIRSAIRLTTVAAALPPDWRSPSS